MTPADAKRALLRDLLARRAAEPRRYPTSFAQERLWFLDRLVPGNPFYNVEAAIPIDASLDPAVLERAVNEIVARHGALRTTFRDDGAGPLQVVAPELHVPLQRVDLRALSAAERDAAQRAMRRERARTAFDLERGPLILTDLLRLGECQWLFLLHMHHIVADGWSMGVFSRELSALYEAFAAGMPSPLLPLKLQYGDFAAWQRASFSGEALARQLDFWRRQLEGLQPLELPADRARPPVQSHRGAFHTAHLSAALSQQVHAFCRAHGVTPFMSLLAAFKALLARYAGRDDVAVGTYIAGREREEVEPLIGFFLNTLVLRTRLDPDSGFSALARQVKETALGAYAHQALPFATLVHKLAPERDLSRNPLVQVVFQLQNATSAEAAGGAQAMIDYQRGAAIFDIAVTCYEAQGSFHATWEYSSDLFDAATIEQMARHYERLLAAALAEPGLPLRQLPLMDADERAQVLVRWNARRVPYPPSSITELLHERAAARPDAVVFIEGDKALTLRELQARSEALARRLRAAGLQAGQGCGVCLPRCLALPVALFAVWRAGGVYVPLDPDYPRERLLYMLRDCGAAVLVGRHGDAAAATLAQSAGIPCVDPADQSPVPVAELPAPPALDATSHVIYTSGSTGRPKAAPSPHRQIVNRLHWMWREAAFAPDEVGSVKTATSFIDSLWELLGMALQGLPSVIVPQAVLVDPAASIALLARHRVTRLWLVPSYLRALLDAAGGELGARLPALKFWVASGEVLPVELQQRLRREHPQATLYNLYGTSEVWDATWHDPHDPHDPPDPPDPQAWPAQGLTRVPIGKPIDNVPCFVLDRFGTPVPPGVVGELHVGGDALGSVLDSPRRVQLAWPDLPAQAVWACGDLVRWRRDASAGPAGEVSGRLEFVGRSDAELKLRGMRVEPAEVESVLMEHPAVHAAALLAWPAPAGGLRLVAYVQADSPVPSTASLRAHMAERLPAFMLPEQIVFVDALPHTGSGKLDREALRRRGDPIAAVPAAAGLAPRNDTESAVAAIWAELLGRPASVDDNFFALGGHSLLATQVVTRIEQRLRVRVALRRFFEGPTIAALAAAVDQALRSDAPPAQAIPRAERRALVPGAAGRGDIQ